MKRVMGSTLVQETAVEVLEKGDVDLRRAMAAALKDGSEEQGYGAFFIGMSYGFGEHGLAKDLVKARRWYGLGAWAYGSAEALTNLGHAFAHGEGGRQSYRLANLCYRRAIRQGDWLAKGNYAYHLWKGLGVAKRDPVQAARLYHDCIYEATEVHELDQAEQFMLDYADLCESGDIPKDKLMAEWMIISVKILHGCSRPEDLWRYDRRGNRII